MGVEERFDLERRYRDQEAQAQWAGRRKFQFCHWCGRPDGMKAVHRETLIDIPRTIEGGKVIAAWHRESGNDEYLFHPCLSCNRDKIIPADFVSMTTDEVLDWIDRDSMAPDYAALAAEEPMSQIEDSRDSAGMEE